MHFDPRNAVLTIQPKTCTNGGEMAQSTKMIKKTYFSSVKKCFSAKFFYGHVDCIFDNTAKTLLPEAAKKSLDVRKRKEK